MPRPPFCNTLPRHAFSSARVHPPYLVAILVAISVTPHCRVWMAQSGASPSIGRRARAHRSASRASQGDVISTVDDRNVASLGKAFEIEPGCHIVVTRADLLPPTAPRPYVFALPMQPAHAYVIELSRRRSPRAGPEVLDPGPRGPPRRLAQDLGRPRRHAAATCRAMRLAAGTAVAVRHGTLPRPRFEHPEPDRADHRHRQRPGGRRPQRRLRRAAARSTIAERVSCPATIPRVQHSDPLMWVEALDLLLGELASERRRSRRACAGISGAGQQHGSVYLATRSIGRGTGRRTSRWSTRCGRCSAAPPRRSGWTARPAPNAREIARAVGGDEQVMALTGSRAIERFTGPQIRKFAKDDPAGLGAHRRGSPRQLVHRVAAHRRARADRLRRRRRA